MASKIPSTSYFSTSKRAACDRCRKQKLRCPSTTTENKGKACTRCVRASLPCITGYTKPLGRPSQLSASIPLQGDAQQATPAAFESQLSTYADWRPSEFTGPGSSKCANLESNIPSANSATSSVTQEMGSYTLDILAGKDYQSLGSGNRFIQNSWSNENQESGSIDAFNRYSNIPAPQNLLSFFNSSRFEKGILKARDHPLFEDPDTPSDLHSPVETTAIEQGNAPDLQDSNMEKIQFDLNDIVELEAYSNTCLAQLHLDLSRKVHRCVETFQHQDIKAAPLHSERERSCTFGTALCSINSYLEILQSYCSIRDFSSSSEPIKYSPPNILSFLFCYHQLVTVFNKLFLDLISQLTNSPESQSIQPLPDLHLAGFPVPQTSLQIKILSQTVLHQFEHVEKLLCLPVEMRVSNRQDIYSASLLNYEGNKELLQAIAVRERGGEGGSVALLRGNIEKVQNFLEDME